EAACKAVGGVHRDGADTVVAEMLLDLGDQRARLLLVPFRDVDSQRVVDLREPAGEDGVDDDAFDLDDPAGLLRVSVSHCSPKATAVTDARTARAVPAAVSLTSNGGLSASL